MTDREACHQFIIFQKAQEQKYQDRFYSLIRRQARVVSAYVRKNGVDMTEISLNLLIRPEDTAKELRRLYRDVGVRWANMEYGNLEEFTKAWTAPLRFKRFGFNELWESFLNIFFEAFGGKKIVSIDATTKDWIIRKLQQGRVDGLGAEQIALSIMDDKDIPLMRARVISRTETVAAANFGGNTAARQTGLKMVKRWVNARDIRVRELHKNVAQGGVGGEEVGLDEPFSNGLMYPGDPLGSAKEVIQCRCLASHRPARDENGMPIRI